MRHWLVVSFSLAFVVMGAGAVEAHDLVIQLYRNKRCGTSSAAQPICRRASFLAAYHAAVAKARITSLAVARAREGVFGFSSQSTP
jgi:hypothetical protein